MSSEKDKEHMENLCKRASAISCVLNGLTNSDAVFLLGIVASDVVKNLPPAEHLTAIGAMLRIIARHTDMEVQLVPAEDGSGPPSLLN